MMWTEEIKEALLSQWRHEVENAHFYLSIESFLNQKGFKNIANIFKQQYRKELSHSRMIIDLMNDLDIPVAFPPIRAFDIGQMNISQIGDSYFQKEYNTTKSLKEIVSLSEQEGCGIIEEFMRKMVQLQQAEMDESLTFKSKANIVGDDWKTVLLWDAGLG